MAARSGLIIGAGGGILALAGIAPAAQERDPKGAVSERRIDLKQVPQGTLTGATEVLASVRRAEFVRLRDGRIVYELTGETASGETLAVHVSASGQVIGTEGADDED
jgi:hypothetical protein